MLKDAPITELAEALRVVHKGGRVIAPELAVAAWGESDPLTDRERDVPATVPRPSPRRGTAASSDQGSSISSSAVTVRQLRVVAVQPRAAFSTVAGSLVLAIPLGRWR